MSIILHIPHDSKIIPENYRDDFLLNDDELAQEIIAMTDMHTDELYHYENAERIVFPVSRLLLDPERFTNDDQEIMAARGMGVLYEVTSQLKPLRPKLNEAKRQAILNEYYFPHHQKLTQAVVSNLRTNQKCLIVDCHSFPSRPLPYELCDNNDLRAQICIGTDSFHTPQRVSDYLYEFFTQKGYDVSIDDPFAGALVPMDFYHQDKSVMSVMYEIRRDLYMNEKTGEKTENFSHIQSHITDSIQGLNEIY
jgi:N-formylglutamate amidohydrolase